MGQARRRHAEVHRRVGRLDRGAADVRVRVGVVAPEGGTMGKDPSRRQVLAGLGTAWVTGAATTALGAETADHAAHGLPNAALAAAAGACVQAGEACVAHCLERFRAGDTSLGACATSVEQMLAVCHATQRLALTGSPRLAALSTVCVEVCTDCEKE